MIDQKADEVVIKKSEVKSFEIIYKNGIELKYTEKKDTKMGFTKD